MISESVASRHVCTKTCWKAHVTGRHHQYTFRHALLRRAPRPPRTRSARLGKSRAARVRSCHDESARVRDNQCTCVASRHVCTKTC